MNKFFILFLLFAATIVVAMDIEHSLITNSHRAITLKDIQDTITILKKTNYKIPKNITLLFDKRHTDILPKLDKRYDTKKLPKKCFVSEQQEFAAFFYRVTVDSYKNVTCKSEQLSLRETLFSATFVALKRKVISQHLYRSFKIFKQPLCEHPATQYEYSRLIELALGTSNESQNFVSRLLSALHCITFECDVWYDLVCEFLLHINELKEWGEDKNIISILTENVDPIIDKFKLHNIFANHLLLYCFHQQLIEKESQQKLLSGLKLLITPAIEELVTYYKKYHHFNNVGACYSPLPIRTSITDQQSINNDNLIPHNQGATSDDDLMFIME